MKPHPTALLFHATASGQAYLSTVGNGCVMRLAWLVLAILLLPTVGADGLVEIPEEESAITFAVELPLDGSEIRHPTQVVELFTATWCMPCRPAEIAVRGLGEDVGVVELHASNFSDEFHFPDARMRFKQVGAEGYPTVVVDDRWRLMSRSQASEIDDLVAALPDLDGEQNGSAAIVGGVIRIHLDAGTAATLDVWVVDGTRAIAGITNLSWNGSATNLSIPVSDGQAMLDADHVLIVWRDGQTTLRNASTTPINDTTPKAKETNWTMPILVGLLILALMMPAFMTTIRRLPVLLGRQRDEEE